LDRFATGPAQACGVATTRSEEQVIDTFEMYATYLPIVYGVD
jgi:hypothetical protein